MCQTAAGVYLASQAIITNMAVNEAVTGTAMDKLSGKLEAG